MAMLRLAFNLLRRDWRAGEWRVLLLALILSVGSLATVGLFADRVRMALQQQASSLLGADLRVNSTRVLPASYTLQAKQMGLSTTPTRKLLSMVMYQDESLLCEILAVESIYPLRGKMEVLPVQQTTSPVRGTVWLDTRALTRLNVKVGDSLSIGQSQFRVAAQIVKDVDQSVSFYGFSPKVLMHLDDLAGTGLDQEGSRMSYRLLVAGDAQQVAQFDTKVRPLLQPAERMESIRDARPEIRTALERTEHFLGLAALTAAILAGVALLLASRRFVLRHLDSCAVMRCLGAQQQQVLQLFLYQLLILGVLAIGLGAVLGYVAQAVLVQLLDAFAMSDLPLPSWTPLLKAALSGLCLLLGFAFLPLLQLRKVSPLRVLRRELGAPEMRQWVVYTVAGLALASLFVWQAGSLKLGLAVLLGLLLGALVFAGLAWWLLRYVRFAFLPAQLRHALANLSRHGGQSALQIVALSLGGMALLLLTMVRADLLQSWRDKLPIDTPNHFIASIQPEQRQTVLDWFAQRQLAAPALFPMIRGRLVAVNQQPISSAQFSDPQTKQLLEREFNLSYATQPPSWNQVVAGRWWKTGETGLLSVEQGLAERLKLKLGDVLSYDVAGVQRHAKISNFRKLQWDSMQVNFFVISTPDVLQAQPASYLTSVYWSNPKWENELSQMLPNVLVFSTEELIQRVRQMIEQITYGLSAVLSFTLLAGLVVLYAAILATQDERIKEAAILRTLGIDAAYLRRLHLSEFAILGLLSGLFAAAGAILLGWVLAHFVLEIPYFVSHIIWFVAGGCGMFLVMLFGWLTTRHLGTLPPLVVLREQ